MVILIIKKKESQRLSLRTFFCSDALAQSLATVQRFGLSEKKVNSYTKLSAFNTLGEHLPRRFTHLE